MVFDATIRPTGQVGLEPGAGLKRFTPSSEWDGRAVGIMYADRAVVLQWFLGRRGGWKGLAVKTRSIACRRALNASYLSASLAALL